TLNANGIYEIESVSFNAYLGIPGKINVPAVMELYVADLTGKAQDRAISNSYSLNNSGNKTDIKDADISRLYDAAGRIRYRVIDSIRYKGQEAIRYKEEYKNGRGLLEERHFGRVDKNGKWVDEMTVYSFYMTDAQKLSAIGNGKAIGKYEVADITVTTVYDENGNNESIYSLSNNNTGINPEGNVFYATKFGKKSIPTLTESNNYNTLKINLRDLDHSKDLGLYGRPRQEIKDNKGRLIIIKDGYEIISPKGFGVGASRWITFLRYESLIPFSTEAFGYKWNTDNGDVQVNYNDSRWYSHSSDLELKEGLFFSTVINRRGAYDVKQERGFSLDGRLNLSRIPFAGKYLAGVPILTSGTEETKYDIYEQPLNTKKVPGYSKGEGERLIKEFQKFEFIGKKDEYYKYSVKEHEALAPSRVRYWDYYYDVDGLSKKQILRYDPEEMTGAQWKSVGIYAGIVLAAIVIFAMIFGKLSLDKTKARLMALLRSKKFLGGSHNKFESGQRKSLENLVKIREEVERWRQTGYINNEQYDNIVRDLDEAIRVTGTNITDNPTAAEYLTKREAQEKALGTIIEEVAWTPKDDKKEGLDAKRGIVKRFTFGWISYLPIIDFSFDEISKLRGSGADIRGFKRWLEDSGLASAEQQRVLGLFRQNPLLALIIFETVEDMMGTAFKTDAVNVRYYFLYKFIDSILSRENGTKIFDTLRSEIAVLFAFMKDKAPGPAGQNAKSFDVTKNKVITSEDLGYIFARKDSSDQFMQRLLKEFSPLFYPLWKLGREVGDLKKALALGKSGQNPLTAEEIVAKKARLEVVNKTIIEETTKLDEIISKIVEDSKVKITSGFKIFKGRGVIEKDKPILAFFINLWQPIVLLLSAVGLNILALAIGMPGSLGLLAMTVGFVVAMALLTGITNKINTKNDRSKPLTDGNPRKTALAFWSYFSLMLGSGFTINYFMLEWSKEVIVSLMQFGLVGVWGFMVPVALLTGLIIILTFMSAAYAFEALFAYIEGKREGVGQIKTLAQAEKNFGKARDKFIVLSETARADKDQKIEVFNSVWKTMLSTLRVSGEIDVVAEKWLRDWLENTKAGKQGFISEEAEERIMRAVEGWLMDLTPVLWWDYVSPVSVMAIGSSEPIWWGMDKATWVKDAPKNEVENITDIRKFDDEFGREETALNYTLRKFPRKKAWVEFINDNIKEDLFKEFPADERWVHVEIVKDYLLNLNLSGIELPDQIKLLSYPDVVKKILDAWVKVSLEVYKINILTLESNGEETRLNNIIRKLRMQWEFFVNGLNVSFKIKAELLALKGTEIPSADILLNHDLVYDIEKWINSYAWSVGRTLTDFENLRHSWEILSKLHFPDATEEQVGLLADRRLQLVFHYPDYFKLSLQEKERLHQILADRPYIELDNIDDGVICCKYRDDKSIEVTSKSYVYLDIGLYKRAKTVAQGYAWGHLWGRVVFFTDANSTYRIEEMIRLPFSLTGISEFVSKASDFILYGEHIFPKNLSIQGKVISITDEVWTRVVQRFINMLGGCSFYGHSAWTYRQIVMAVSGTPHDYPSEDIMLGMRLWENGFSTDHKEHVWCGKSRPTGWSENLAPYGKYPAGAADLGVSNALRELLKSKTVLLSQKFAIIYKLAFYYINILIITVQKLYLHWVFLLGVSGYIAFKFPIFMGIVGLVVMMIITLQGFVYFVERYPIHKAIWRYALLMPANAVTHMPYIGIYALNFILGLLGWAKFKVTAKGLNTGWLEAGEMYAYKSSKDNKNESSKKPKIRESAFFFGGRLILFGTVLGGVISLAILLGTVFYTFLNGTFLSSTSFGEAVLPLLRWPSYPWLKLLYFAPLVIAPLAFFFLRGKEKDANGNRSFQFRKELWPVKKADFASVNALIKINASLLVPIIAGIFIWQNPILLWSLPYILMPVFSVLTPLLFQSAIGLKIINGKIWGVKGAFLLFEAAFAALSIFLGNIIVSGLTEFSTVTLLGTKLNLIGVGVGIFIFIVSQIEIIFNDLTNIIKTNRRIDAIKRGNLGNNSGQNVSSALSEEKSSSPIEEHISRLNTIKNNPAAENRIKNYIDQVLTFLKEGVDARVVRQAVEVSLNEGIDEKAKMAILFALPLEALSEGMNALVIAHKPAPEARNEALKNYVADIESYFNLVMAGKEQAWDTIIITSTVSMTPLYQAYLERLRGVLYPSNTTVLILDESHLGIVPGMPCGNGGATATVLKYLKDNYGSDVFEKGILVVHAGGAGKRLPEALAEGTKALTVVPKLLPNGDTSTNMAEAIKNTFMMSQKIKEIGGGVYITNCDGFLLCDFKALALTSEGINILTAPLDMERIADKLGAVHDVNVIVDIFVEKRPRGETAEAFKDDERYTTTGLIPANTANYYIPAWSADYIIAIWEDDTIRGKAEIDTAGQMLTPLALNMSEASYVKDYVKGEIDPIKKAGREEFAKRIFSRTRPLGRAFNIYMGEFGFYEDLGESELFLHGKTSIVGEIFAWKNKINAYIGEGVEVRDGAFVTDTVLKGQTTIGNNSWVIGLGNGSNVRIGKNSLFYDGVGVHAEGLEMRDEETLFIVPVVDKSTGERRIAVCWRELKDDPKKSQVWGHKIIDLAQKAGVYEELEYMAMTKINPTGMTEDYGKIKAVIERFILWDVPLWPLLREGDNIQEALGWMNRGELPSQLYKKSRKVSMQWINQRFDYERKIHKIKEAMPLVSRSRIVEIEDMLLSDQAGQALQAYEYIRDIDSRAAVKLMDIFKACLLSNHPHFRWSSRWVVGVIIGINIQRMLEIEDKAQEVKDRYLQEKNKDTKEIMQVMLKSSIKEPAYTNINKAASWVLNEIKGSSSPVEISSATIKGMIISIDGLSRAGKTDIAKKLSEIINGVLFDRGSIFRAITYKAIRDGIVFNDEEAMLRMLDKTTVVLEKDRVLLDGIDITDNIRTEEINAKVSDVWQASQAVEARLVIFINDSVKDMALRGPVIITGRSKYPYSLASYFVTVSVEERAKRELVRLSMPFNEENIAKVKESIEARDAKDKVPSPDSTDTVIIENNDFATAVNEILNDLDKKLSLQIKQLASTTRNPIPRFKLNEFYTPNLPLRSYSSQEIKILLNNYTQKLASQLDLNTLTGKLDYYLLMVRSDYFINEVLSDPDNDFFKAMVGTTGVAPYIVEQILSREGINVFLARDSGRDFTAAYLMDKLGILPNNSVVYHLSRKNMGPGYKITKAIVEKYYNHIENREQFVELAYYDFINAMEENESFRRRAVEVYEELQELGIFYHRKVRFIDSWAAGTILYYLVLLTRFFNEYEIINGKVTVRNNQLLDVEIDCRAADPKTRVLSVDKIDQVDHHHNFNQWWMIPSPSLEWHLRKDNNKTAIPSVDWQGSSISLEKIRGWYIKHAIRPPPLSEKDVTDFAMLMSAQIFKPHNPYGALNLGHRIDWNSSAKQLYTATPAKRLGAFFREIMVINSVMDYAQAENIAVKKDAGFMLTENTVVFQNDKNSIFNELAKDFAKLGYYLDEKEIEVLNYILLIHSEHVATSNDNLQIQIIINMMHTIRTLGVNAVYSAFENNPYDSQYYIHSVKSLTPVEFRTMLYTMIDIYGIEFAKELFTGNIMLFTDELMNINDLAERLRHPKTGAMFDIDGTILPIEQVIRLFTEMLKNGIFLSFNSGRPLPGIHKLVLDQMKELLAGDIEKIRNLIYLYVSNANQGLTIDGQELYPRGEFDVKERALIAGIIKEFDLTIISQRPYRIILKVSREVVDITYLSYLRELVEQRLNESGSFDVSVSMSGEPGAKVEVFNSIDITSSTKKRGLDDFKNRLSVILGRSVNYENIFIAGDQPKGNDMPILKVKGAYSVESFGVRKVAALLRKSAFISPQGKLLRFDASDKLVEADNFTSSPVISQNRIFETTNDTIYRALDKLAKVFNLSLSELDDFRTKVLMTFSNDERLLRYINEIIAQKDATNDGLDEIVSRSLRTLYATADEFPLFLIAMLRLYSNEQKLLVVARNSKIIKTLEILRNSKLGRYMAEAFGIDLPAEKDIVHLKIGRFDSLATTINSMISKEDRDQVITLSVAEQIIASLSNDEFRRINVSDLIGLTRAQAIQLVANMGKIDARFIEAERLIRETFDTSIRAIKKQMQNGAEDIVVIASLSRWASKIYNLAVQYPELNLPIKDIWMLKDDLNFSLVPSVELYYVRAKEISRILSERVNNYFSYNAIEYSTMPALQVLVEGTQIGSDIRRNGVMFLEDIVATGGTFLSAKLIAQVFASSKPFMFVSAYDSSRFPANAFVESMSWIQLPEDWQELEQVIDYKVSTKDGVRFYSALTLDELENELDMKPFVGNKNEFAQYIALVEEVAAKIHSISQTYLSMSVSREIARMLVDSKMENSVSVPEGLTTSRFVREYLRPNAAIHSHAERYMNLVDKLVDMVKRGDIVIPAELKSLRNNFRVIEELEIIRFWKEEASKAETRIKMGTRRLMSTELVDQLNRSLEAIVAFRKIALSGKEDKIVLAYQEMHNEIRELAVAYAKRYNKLQAESEPQYNLKSDKSAVTIIRERALFEASLLSSSPIDSSIASYILTHTSVSKLEGRYLLDAFNEL
ncbi:MAG: (d)CMP kinase, partial [Candidatus Omnitrophota bacterium]